MRPRDVEKIIVADGWVYKTTKGSHKHFVHPTKPGKVTIRSILVTPSMLPC